MCNVSLQWTRNVSLQWHLNRPRGILFRSNRRDSVVGKVEHRPLQRSGGVRWRGWVNRWEGEESEYLAERSTRRSLHSCCGADKVHADRSCFIGQCRQVVGVYENVSASR